MSFGAKPGPKEGRYESFQPSAYWKRWVIREVCTIRDGRVCGMKPSVLAVALGVTEAWVREVLEGKR